MNNIGRREFLQASAVGLGLPFASTLAASKNGKQGDLSELASNLDVNEKDLGSAIEALKSGKNRAVLLERVGPGLLPNLTESENRVWQEISGMPESTEDTSSNRLAVGELFAPAFENRNSFVQDVNQHIPEGERLRPEEIRLSDVARLERTYNDALLLAKLGRDRESFRALDAFLLVGGV